MGAAWPATRPALALRQVFAAPADALAARLRLLRGFDPADPLVAGQRRNVVPGRQRFGLKLQRLLQVIGKRMDDATSDLPFVSHPRSARSGFQSRCLYTPKRGTEHSNGPLSDLLRQSGGDDANGGFLALKIRRL